jgi:hypothetical protein
LGHGPEDYAQRAEECVRLANSTKDEMIQRELLELRQIYLRTMERLTQLQAAPGTGRTQG